MFDQYSVLVRLSLQNQVSAGLLGMSRQFEKLQAQATALQARLNSIKVLGLTGLGLSAAGFMGLNLFDKALKHGEEYAHQLNILKMAGLSQVEVAKAVGTAWENTHKVMSVSATESLRMWNDLRIVFGSSEEATRTLPFASIMQGILLASKEGKEAGSDKDFAFSVAKALDIIGAVKNKEEFTKEATMMTADIAAFQGRVTPKMFQSTFAYARQAKLAMDDTFKYEILPTLMMEYAASGNSAGGGSRGVGPMIAAMYRFTNQGFVNKQAIPLLTQLGLIQGSSKLYSGKYDDFIEKNGAWTKTTTPGTTLKHGLVGSDLAGRNSFLWVQEVLLPALHKKFGDNLSNQQIQSYINQIARGNQLAGSLMTEFAIKGYAFLRDMGLVQQAMKFTPQQLFNVAASSDPRLARQMLSEQWDNLMTSLSVPIVTLLIPALTQFASVLNTLATYLIEYPTLAKALSYSFVTLSLSLMFSGTVLLLSAAFKGLALSMTVIEAVMGKTLFAFGFVGAAIGVIVYYIHQLMNMDWKEVFREIPIAWKMIKNATSEGLHWLGSAFSSFWSWVKGLFGFGGAAPGQAPVAPGATNAQKQALNAHNLDPVKGSNINTVQVHSTINLDGRAVANAVTQHQVSAMTSVPNYSSRFDTGMTPTPVLANLNSY